ncbi:MAG TPA: CorA family divalent cation transporter [Solirubrobacterales bacterium]|nr:CorA family divalent cation transporter [Solirubrobacterales bacterium]
MTRWRPGRAPQEVALAAVPGATGVHWIDLDGEISRDRTGEVATLLEPACPGLTAEMVGDLLTPDDQPAGRRYAAGAVRLASTFTVETRRPDSEYGERGTGRGPGALVFQPVELLATKEWLVTCWHPSRAFLGAKKIGDEGGAGSGADVRDAVVERWTEGQGESAGDLGLLVMYELALSYAPAHRELYHWLEDWELSLYVEDRYDPTALPLLWGEMAVFRDWLVPLNPGGVTSDIGRAWLPCTDREGVKQLDDKIDSALDNLRELGKTLRTSFGVLHAKQAEEQRDRSESVQRRIEIIAAAFLIPTLIVGFYGANTWVPGETEHWGFWIMVAALVLFSLTGVAVVTRWQQRQKAALEQVNEERKRLRAELRRETGGEA